MIDIGFVSDWMRKQREFLKQILQHSDTKHRQMEISFDSQLKTAPIFPIKVLQW